MRRLSLRSDSFLTPDVAVTLDRAKYHEHMIFFHHSTVHSFCSAAKESVLFSISVTDK